MTASNPPPCGRLWMCVGHVTVSLSVHRCCTICCLRLHQYLFLCTYICSSISVPCGVLVGEHTSNPMCGRGMQVTFLQQKHNTEVSDGKKNSGLSTGTAPVLKTLWSCIVKLLAADLTETITITDRLLLEEIKRSDMLHLQVLLFSNPELEGEYRLFLSLTM